jgi:hypothetical protein
MLTCSAWLIAKLDLTYLSQIGPRESHGSEGDGENVDFEEDEDIIDGEDVEEGENDEKAPKTAKTKKRKTAFDQLVLPGGHKKIVLSLIAQHIQEKSSRKTENEETDIVRGKGKRFHIYRFNHPAEFRNYLTKNL